MQTNNKLREALKEIEGYAWVHGLWEIEPIAKDALDEQPRNCDVGTVEEQMKRQHDTMCNTTKACPDSDWSCRKCFAEWSQMPYEEGQTMNRSNYNDCV